MVRVLAQAGAAVATVGAALQEPGRLPAGPRRLLADPQRLLAPAAAKGARSKLNLLEVLGMGAVTAFVGFFYLVGFLNFGVVEMLKSGTPLFGGWALLLMFGLAALRNLMDKPLGPILRLLQKLPAKLRLVLGFLAPLGWVIFDSRDVGSGFQHAMVTITVATALGHLFFRSLRRPA